MWPGTKDFVGGFGEFREDASLRHPTPLGVLQVDEQVVGDDLGIVEEIAEAIDGCGGDTGAAQGGKRPRAVESAEIIGQR